MDVRPLGIQLFLSRASAIRTQNVAPVSRVLFLCQTDVTPYTGDYVLFAAEGSPVLAQSVVEAVSQHVLDHFV